MSVNVCSGGVSHSRLRCFYFECVSMSAGYNFHGDFIQKTVCFNVIKVQYGILVIASV